MGKSLQVFGKWQKKSHHSALWKETGMWMKWCNGLGPNHSNINWGQHPHLDFFFSLNIQHWINYNKLEKLEPTAYSAGSTVKQPEGKCMRCVPTQIIFSKVSIFILCLKTGSMQDIHRLFYYFILFIFLYLLLAYLTAVDTHTHTDISEATWGSAS